MEIKTGVFLSAVCSQVHMIVGESTTVVDNVKRIVYDGRKLTHVFVHFTEGWDDRIWSSEQKQSLIFLELYCHYIINLLHELIMARTN